MSPVTRACIPGPVVIDVNLLHLIEAALMMDTAEPPGVVAPLAAQEWDERPDTCVHDLLDADECHTVQRLRGWHRTRYGRIKVDAYWLAATRNLLDALTLSLGSECDYMLQQVGYDPELHAEIKARMDADRGCGDCLWCQCLDLRDQCDEILDAAGYDGGSRYRAYVLGETRKVA